MLKKLTAFALTLMLLCVTFSTAFAWSCPGCGLEMSGKFCAECGTKKPEENICPGCGTNYGDQTPKFCSECGTKMGAAVAPTAAPTKAVPTSAPTKENVKVMITKQPQDVTVALGETAAVSVTATGQQLTYVWYYRNAGVTKFTESTTTTNTYAVEMTEARAGRQVYCVVTDMYGNTAQSDTVTLNMSKSTSPVLAPATPVPSGVTAPVAPAATPVPTTAPVVGGSVSGSQTSKGLEITSAKENGDGTVTMTWTDNGKGPFDIEYLLCVSGNMDADKELGYAYWAEEYDVSGTSYTIGYLIPGQDYWLIVKDSERNEASYYIQMSAAKKSDMDMRITLTPRRNDSGTYTDLDRFDPDALNRDYTESYGMYFYLKYNKLSADCKKNALFVLTMPTGDPLVIKGGVDSINLFANGVTMWDCFNLDWPFSRAKNWYGEVPEGIYTVDVYIDGAYAATSSFQVGEAKVMAQAVTANNGMTIESLVRNDDGSLTITWNDPSGKGPYQVDYGQKVSGDFEADYDNLRSVGMFYDTKDAYVESHTLNYLAPGQAYWIAIYNADGQRTYCAYEPPAAETFSEYTVKLSHQLKQRTSSGDTKVNYFTSAEIAKHTTTHGMYLKASYPQLARERNYVGRVVIEAPTGAVVTDGVVDIHFDRGAEGYIYWTFYDLEWYLGVLENRYGAVPTGTYTVKLYLDTYYAGSTDFTIYE